MNINTLVAVPFENRCKHSEQVGHSQQPIRSQQICDVEEVKNQHQIQKTLENKSSQISCSSDKSKELIENETIKLNKGIKLRQIARLIPQEATLLSNSKLYANTISPQRSMKMLLNE